MSDHRQLEGGIALLRRVIAPGGRASKLAFPVRRLAPDGLDRARYWQRPCTYYRHGSCRAVFDLR